MLFFLPFFFQEKKVWGRDASLAGRKMKLLHQTLFRIEFCELPEVPPSAGSYGVDLCCIKPKLTRTPSLLRQSSLLSTYAGPKSHKQNANEVPKEPKGGKADLLTSISHRKTIG